MTQKLEEKIKVLERELALKQAYLSVNFTFPKNSKLPTDVQEQVMSELRKACDQLAADKDESAVEANELKNFSADDIKILQELVSAVKTKKAQPSPSASNAKAPRTEPGVTSSSDGGIRKALLLTSENVAVSVRNKVAPESVVFVKKVEDGRAVVVNKDGVLFHVPVEDLEFQET